MSIFVPVPEVTFAKGRILIDTTGGQGGELSAILLPEKKVLTVDMGYRP